MIDRWYMQSLEILSSWKSLKIVSWNPILNNGQQANLSKQDTVAKQNFPNEVRSVESKIRRQTIQRALRDSVVLTYQSDLRTEQLMCVLELKALTGQPVRWHFI